MNKKSSLIKIKIWLAALSFRTGVIVLAICALCYAISFLQILLPISAGTKWLLWVVFFGLAKTTQYSALLIIGKAGIQRLKARFRPIKN